MNIQGKKRHVPFLHITRNYVKRKEREKDKGRAGNIYLDFPQENNTSVQRKVDLNE